MTKAVLHRVGRYLGRDVQCGVVEVKDLRRLVMHDSLVLINTADARLAGEEQNDLVQQIVQLRPLGVVFTGPAGEMMFDRLLHALDTPTDPVPMMTSFSTEALPQAVDEFLSSTWPAEERWDEWQGYLLIGVGGSVHELEQAVTSVIGATTRR